MSAVAVSPPGPARPAFVGRTDELRRLRALTARLADGHGGALMVEGEAGIGKTRLLDEVAADVDLGGFELFRAPAEELDARRPFGAIAECLRLERSATDPAAAELASLLFGHPAHGPAGKPSEVQGAAGDGRAREARLVDAVVGVVEDACARGPVVVAVEDLQWADTETLLVLHRLCRLVGDLPLLVVGTCRPGPQSPALDRLRQSMGQRGGGSPLLLGPLAPAEVGELLAAVLPAAPGPRLSRQLAGTAGNPFFVLELVAALQADGAIRVGPEVAEIDVVAFPPALAVAVLHRLSFLPDEVLDVLRIASVLGSRFSVHDLAAVLGRATVALAPTLRQARLCRVLVDDGDRMAFRHDLIREALYEDLPRAVRMSLHRDIAVALGESGATAVQVAEHFVRGAKVGDPMAVEWVLRAAGEVTTRSPDVAADLLKSAVDLFEPGDRRRDSVIADWILSLSACGRRREVTAPCVELLARSQAPAVEVRLRLVLAQLYIGSGRLDAALAQAKLLLELPGLSDAQRARVIGAVALFWVAVPDLETVEHLANLASELADAVGDRVANAQVSLLRSTVALRRGRYQSAWDEIAACFVVDDTQPGQRIAYGVPHLNHLAALAKVGALNRLDRTDEAATLLDSLRDETERGGFRLLLGTAFQTLALHCFERGDWEGALVAYQSLVETCEEGDVEALFEPGRLEAAAGMRAMLAIHRGDLSTARRLVGGQQHAESGLWRWADRAVALLAEADGRPDVAYARLWRGWQLSARAGTATDFPSVGPELVRLALAGGDPAALGDARAVAEAVEGMAAANSGVASVEGAALRCRGLLAADARVLVEARDNFVRAGRLLDAAVACEDAAVLLGPTDRVASRALFEEAIARYEELEASWDTGRANARMRELGMRRGSQKARRRPASGWEALTPSERSVVELVAEGMSNPAVAQRLFLSRATVKTHVSNALNKLHLTSRVELARAAANR